MLHEFDDHHRERSVAPPAKLVRVAKIAAVLLLVVAALTVLAYRHLATRESETPPVMSRLSSFSLYDQHGKNVELAALDDTIWVADFIFTSCQAACPMLTSRMRALQKHLELQDQAKGRPLPIKLVSFSVDPEVDTPDKLAAYAAKWGADDKRWLFLTGPLGEVNRAVTQGLKIPFEKGGADTAAFDVMHGEHFVVVDGAHQIRGYFDTDPAGIERLKTTLEVLLKEKGR